MGAHYCDRCGATDRDLGAAFVDAVKRHLCYVCTVALHHEGKAVRVHFWRQQGEARPAGKGGPRPVHVRHGEEPVGGARES